MVEVCGLPALDEEEERTMQTRVDTAPFYASSGRGSGRWRIVVVRPPPAQIKHSHINTGREEAGSSPANRNHRDKSTWNLKRYAMKEAEEQSHTVKR